MYVPLSARVCLSPAVLPFSLFFSPPSLSLSLPSFPFLSLDICLSLSLALSPPFLWRVISLASLSHVSSVVLGGLHSLRVPVVGPSDEGLDLDVAPRPSAPERVLDGGDRIPLGTGLCRDIFHCLRLEEVRRTMGERGGGGKLTTQGLLPGFARVADGTSAKQSATFLVPKHGEHSSIFRV